jgi:hypothetical protein
MGAVIIQVKSWKIVKNYLKTLFQVLFTIFNTKAVFYIGSTKSICVYVNTGKDIEVI